MIKSLQKFTKKLKKIAKFPIDNIEINNIQLNQGLVQRIYGGDVVYLTDREKEVVALMELGLNNRQIAQRLGISSHTAKSHVANILCKLEVKNRVLAVVKIIQLRRQKAAEESGVLECVEKDDNLDEN